MKIRGYRIELGEIEARLLEHPQVQEAMVLAREDEPGEKRLVAYYAAREEVRAEELRRTGLSSAAAVHGASGVCAASELAADTEWKGGSQGLTCSRREAYGHRGYETPQGSLEESLARMWRELLQVEQVGRHDDFFELGGHSLLAVQLISRMRDQGLQVDVRALFSTPTLKELAAHVRLEGAADEIPPNGIPAAVSASRPQCSR